MEISKMKLRDLVRLVSTIQNIDDDQYFIEIEFRDVEGNTKRTVMPRSLIRSGSKALARIIQPVDPFVAQTGVLALLDCAFAAPRTRLFVPAAGQHADWRGFAG